jgi:hypothetical protein
VDVDGARNTLVNTGKGWPPGYHGLPPGFGGVEWRSLLYKDEVEALVAKYIKLMYLGKIAIGLEFCSLGKGWSASGAGHPFIF